LAFGEHNKPRLKYGILQPLAEPLEFISHF
jgi:hypothetical protein